jgi:mRNA-degrading endonuclease RelE of RelBE toxin-antitoxin system
MNELKFKAVRIRQETHKQAKELAKKEGRFFEHFADELLSEAIKHYKAKKGTAENQITTEAAA